MHIPLIDVSAISLDQNQPSKEGWQKVSKDLATALSHFGFAYLTNHGISNDCINHCFTQSKSFFDLPQDVKDNHA